MPKKGNRLAEIEEILKRFGQGMEELRKQIRDVNAQVGNLTDGWGKFVEGLVSPSIPPVFKGLGMDISGLSLRAKRFKDGRVLEVDIMALGKREDGKKVVLVVEVKSNLESKDVDNFINVLLNFPEFFEEYKDREVLGVVAGIRFGNGAEQYAENRGLYILAPSGETMVLLNKPDFQPKVWKR